MLRRSGRRCSRPWRAPPRLLSPPGRGWRCGWWASWRPKTSSLTGRAPPTPCTRARASRWRPRARPRSRRTTCGCATGRPTSPGSRPAPAALAAVAVVGPALARQTSAESTDHPVLAALGLSPRQFAARIMLRTLVVAVAGAAGGIAVAGLLSPLAPLGEARLAEPAPGLAFDVGVLIPGALATVAAVLVLGAVPALRATRVRGAADRAPVTRPSVVAGAAATAGAPPGAVIGIRHALERGRGTRAVPVGMALI